MQLFCIAFSGICYQLKLTSLSWWLLIYGWESIVLPECYTLCHDSGRDTSGGDGDFRAGSSCLASIIFVSPLVAAIVCLRAACKCATVWRLGMPLCYRTWSWQASYMVLLFWAQPCLAQWPSDFSWSRSDISIIKTQCLVTGVVNQHHKFV